MTSYRWAFDFLKWSPNKEQIHKCLMLLTIDEIERLQKFVFSNDYRASLIGKLMIKRLIRLNNSNSNSEIKYSEHGKPYVENFDYIFNVSHHGCYTVLVAEPKQHYKAIGVDCMSLRKLNFKLKVKVSNFFENLKKKTSS